MNYLLIGRPRCRTSFLCSAFSKKYSLINFHESLNFTNIFIKEILKIKDSTNTSKRHISHIDQTINTVLDSKGGIIKFFPRHAFGLDFSTAGVPPTIENLTEKKFKLIDNFLDLIKIDKFDKILFVDRDLVDSTLSYIFNMGITNSPLFKIQDEEKLKYIDKKYQSVSIDEKKYFPHINFFVYEYLIHQEFKKLLDSKYSYVNLNYNNCVNYIENTFGKNYKVNYLESNFNYKSKIKNYQEISEYIYDCKNKLENSSLIDLF